MHEICRRHHESGPRDFSLPAIGRLAQAVGILRGRVRHLTPSEREALQKGVSADYLEKQGLAEGTHAEIVNELGRIVFDIGFARGIRKVLGT
ncbi:hypothetical protein BCY88_29475 [Paraburkholderia fungorum]|uniref:Uncharacterized protein n=2 Tax=Paraburkholderia fungorum TaxID=134537 RepID=A0A3R7E5E2_9BURK|nr:hypothetical protein BCY88_29475 [Paraburkholderia fungorum]